MSLLIGSLGVGVAGCGGSGRGSSSEGSSSSRTSKTVVEHVLTVSKELGPIDADDYPVLDFGEEAMGAERHKIVATVKRYYRAAVAGDGAAACSMLYSVSAREIMEDISQAERLKDGACETVMSLLFEREHKRIVADRDSLRVLRVRTNGLDTFVILRFATAFESRKLDLRLVNGSWELQDPLDEIMP